MLQNKNMNTLEAIKERASYRGTYIQESIPKSDLIKIMESGLAAPSGCNQQTTSIITVDNPELLTRIRSFFNHPVGNTAPALIIVLSKQVASYKGTVYSTQDYSACIENMLLSITDLGYASCWIEGYCNAEVGSKIAEVLKVPEDSGYKVVSYLPVGKPSESIKRVQKLPFEERAWFNEWKK